MLNKSECCQPLLFQGLQPLLAVTVILIVVIKLAKWAVPKGYLESTM